ncbi:MAG: hypothetical protein GKR89_36860 [Candidatus Latescibacteria bacterium]|nr:hypothetical protein [Candidatus Latescibacterota bacterium]
MSELFWGLLALRWLLHLLLIGRSAVNMPRDWLSHALLAAYLALGMPALLVGIPSWPAVALLAAGTLIRSSGLWTMRGAFDYSVDQSQDTFVSSGLYRRHRNPLILGYWAELAAFALSLPLTPPVHLLLILLGGILCAWHAHEDNNRFAVRTPRYEAYLQQTGNALLNLVFAQRSYISISRTWGLDLASLYLAGGLWAGLLIWLAYGWPHFISALATGRAIAALGLLASGGPGPFTREHQPYFIAYRAPHKRAVPPAGSGPTYGPPAPALKILGLTALALAAHLFPFWALPLYLVGNSALELTLQFSYMNRTWIWAALSLTAGLAALFYVPSSPLVPWTWPTPNEWVLLSITLTAGLAHSLKRIPTQSSSEA